MQAALAGVVIGAELLRRARQALVRVIADGAVGHGGEHNRHLQLELRRQVSTMSLPFSSRSDASGFSPRNTRVSIGSRSGSMEGFVTWEALMRILSQYTGSGFGIAHGGKQHAAALRLTVDLL